MAIDPHYIPAFSIEEVILDKDTGAPLSGGLVYFEQDNQRGILKPVYQITGTSPNYSYIQLPNPMTLSSIGTFEDALGNPVVPYFYPYDGDLNVELYYVRVTSSEGVEQFTREAVPYLPEQGETSILSIITNELSNPQFAEVLFDTESADYTYNFSGVTDEVVPLAPGWDLIVSCPTSGTVTVSQLTPVGSLNLITNPGTLLNITSAGLTKLQVRQRLFGSPNLWGSGYLSATFVAKTYSGSAVTLDLYYSQSNGTVIDQLLVSASLPASGNYEEFPDSALIPVSNSSDDFPDAYVDIFFDLPLSVEIDITSVMVAATGNTSIDNIKYDQTTFDRQIDQLFHYYKPQLEFKPIPSLLTGWDFLLNPAQFGASVTMTTTAAYVWDQTICKSVVGNIAVVRNTVTGGFQATTANASEAFYQLQYLSGAEAREFLGTTLSMNIHAFRTQAGGACTVKAYLYRGSSAATVPLLPTSLGTIDASGNFTLTAANWTLIPRSNQGQATGTLSIVDTTDYSTLNDIVDLQFTGWEIVDATELSNTDKVAIVVTYSCPTTATVVTVNSIGLVPGDIPTRPAPQTYDAVLAECRQYYEKSYAPTVAVGTATIADAIMLEQAPIAGIQLAGGAVMTLTYYFNQNGFTIQYKQTKRAVPTVSIYSTLTANSPDKITAYLAWIAVNPGAGTGANTIDASHSVLWSVAGSGRESICYQVVTAGIGTTILAGPSQTVGGTSQYYATSSMSFHYTADARLGIVA